MIVVPQEASSGMEIPLEATTHPVAVAGFVVLVLLIIAAMGRRYAEATLIPMWQWITGRDSRAYAEVVAELELVQRQLEASRQERRDADERHSREIAELREQHTREIGELRAQYEADMSLLSQALADTQRHLVEVLAGVNATRDAVESAHGDGNNR
ncbi:hypothetical protein EF834_03685 [Rhodococcus spongiicola]|uniref:Uncharacterized protein n=2 Tax=Rhodococcus spongiicola TaxID=2487352 RepID=A0A3S3AEZ1_9NOCA|nr:hypothetical protein EF834_03685 [Rhodococcus spongiicola]